MCNNSRSRCNSKDSDFSWLVIARSSNGARIYHRFVVYCARLPAVPSRETRNRCKQQVAACMTGSKHENTSAPGGAELQEHNDHAKWTRVANRDIHDVSRPCDRMRCSASGYGPFSFFVVFRGVFTLFISLAQCFSKCGPRSSGEASFGLCEDCSKIQEKSFLSVHVPNQSFLCIWLDSNFYKLMISTSKPSHPSPVIVETISTMTEIYYVHVQWLSHISKINEDIVWVWVLVTAW